MHTQPNTISVKSRMLLTRIFLLRWCTGRSLACLRHALHAIEQFSWFIVRDEGLSYVKPQETLSLDVHENGQDGIKEAVNIQQAHGLAMQPKLGPRKNLKELIERAKPAWHGDKPVCKVCHQHLAFVHRLHNFKALHAAMGKFAGLKKLGDDTYGAPIMLKHAACNLSHQTNVATTIHKLGLASRKLATKHARRTRKGGLRAA